MSSSLSEIAVGLANAVSTTVAEADRVALAPSSVDPKSNDARGHFEWGGSIFAIIFLILTREGRPRTFSNLLVLYLFASFPTFLFNILRGQFGRWVSFLAVGANLFFPCTFSVSRIILFVIVPDWLANELRDGVGGGIICLAVGVILILTSIMIRGYMVQCDCNCICYNLCLGFLVFFPIYYLGGFVDSNVKALV